ncbi:MAG: DsbA family oxidoreductase [Limnobacter sp.]|jgi:predicted DsbA family dithiol-disulfide isomerase|uniref:DsbA family oxidoreductase n=1 Tax=unclassified Limnobacter TaxID=2630203 RepID=UPI000C595940|nr:MULTISPECIES: DsbA family oxidoreductase [unclassified Limnobacter]MAG80491.1 2-hydroxychromene-2-carboxylate isomerase [Sutterellaceae bacterium]PZO16718.1 MAG: 2-hydroxychromene-2-carboxylate isomerase [Betaproteobacteria bacterium]MBT83003.1 2-hydroxychromene-2-carboxylate isomerase [Sutterellaceae bacterium]MDZ4051203.1 DsbA family oxidoreductase [Limnobacter sp.]PZO25443.1 MAG: 2-hydroxychromene-2-carboxylate isomerase [Betaproteobacteria bacterium]|tara:strand:+ start:11378 stop:11974 length:597 start_codon:yes stop_codon:yes gene_type:complete
MSTTPIKIQVWTDFVCPFCLLGEATIEKAIEGLEVEIEWMPFELRPYPTPTLKPEDEYLPRVWKASVYPMAERLGVPIQLPTVSPQPYTRKAFLGLQYAKQQGKGNEYTTAVMKAFFQQNLNIGEDQVLKNILANLGLNPAELDEFVNSPLANAQHDADLHYAKQLGIQAVPSLAVGEQFFSGVPSVQALRDAVQRER